MKNHQLIILFSIVILTVGLFNPILPRVTVSFTPLAVITNDTILHMFTTVTAQIREKSYTMIEANLVTPKIIDAPVSLTVVSWWVAIYAGDQFIQVCAVTSKGLDYFQGNPNSPNTYAVWASDGPVDSTEFYGQYISKIYYNEVHKYTLIYQDKSWNIYLDDQLVKSIPYPHKADTVQISYEINTVLPEIGSNVNCDVATFTDIKIGYNHQNYTLTNFPLNLYGYYETDYPTQNGFNVAKNSNIVQLGWELPNSMHSTILPSPTPIPELQEPIIPYEKIIIQSIPSEFILAPILFFIGTIFWKKEVKK